MADLENPITPDNDGEKPKTGTSTGSGTDQPPATPAPQTQAGDKTRTFSQEEVNDLLGKTRIESRDRAVAGLLSDVGAKDAESLKTIVTTAETQRLEQLSELDKAKEEVNRLQPFEQQATDQGTSLKKYKKAVEKYVGSLMESMEVPDHVKPLLDTMPALEQLAYLTDHGSAFSKQSSSPPANNAADKGSSSNGAGVTERMKKTRRKYNIQ